MIEKSKEFSVFINSTDSYSDLWPAFFGQLQRHWPDFNSSIYLNTEERTYHFKNLDIRCTEVGNIKKFGKRFIKGLDLVDTDNVLLIMIDHFILDSVDNDLLMSYYQYFIDNNLDSLCLMRNPYTKVEPLNYLDLKKVVPPSKDMFSQQIGFWKKNVLMKMALPHEDPWMSEWYGTKRANRMKLNLAYPAENLPIPYYPHGSLVRGKWTPKIIQLMQEYYPEIDLSERGIYKTNPITLKSRIVRKIETFWPRLKSNYDLYFGGYNKFS